MKYFPGQPASDTTPEIVLNLWYFTDESGIVLRIAGRAYAMAGTEKDKLRRLRELSATDFLLATTARVPSHFRLVGEDGQVLQGVVHASQLPSSHASIFSQLIEALENDLPHPARFVDGELEQFSLSIPSEPLCVTTCVMEGDDGSLTPMVSNQPI